MPRRNDRARQLHTEEECDGKTSTRRRISNKVARPPSSDEHEKPSERKTREKAEAIRRARKAARKQAQREGLIPMPKRREPAPRRAPLSRFWVCCEHVPSPLAPRTWSRAPSARHRCGESPQRMRPRSNAAASRFQKRGP